jgi:hypothetical protein
VPEGAVSRLAALGVFRVDGSSWVRQLERMNSVHAHHDASKFARLTHYVIAFHDSTFECVATDVQVKLHPADRPLALSVAVTS